MKLIEIKNNLAKIYYEPANEQLLLSDFLTIDDNNKTILAQAISIETTSKPDTNCAVVKFSLEFDKENRITPYSGYVPTLNANVFKTSANILSAIFSNANESFTIGTISSSVDIPLNVDISLLDNFLYIQSDNIEEKQDLFAKIAQFNSQHCKKTLVLDFDNLTDYKNVKVIEMGQEFKLPISVDTLNYIYENDLNGLSVEEKAIVQDIILEIQEYTKTLEDGYIPFDSLLDVVNSIYDTDKSTGIILLRNKLLKYKQQNLFASSNAEIIALIQAINENNVVVLNVAKTETKWQQEALTFILNNFDEKLYLIANISNENVSKEILGRIYKQTNIVPVLATNYNCDYANDLKAFSKNIILYKPQEQQKAFATYNSFLSKLAQNECVISGVTTYYTPLIIKDISSIFIKHINSINHDIEAKQNEQKANNDNISTNIVESSDTELHLDEPIELTLEDEIAKDVDNMFYSHSTNENLVQSIELTNNEDQMLTEADLEIFDELDAQDDLIIDESAEVDTDIQETINIVENELIDIGDDETTENDNNENDDIDNSIIDINHDADEQEVFDNFENETLLEPEDESEFLLQEDKENSSIPVYSTNVEEKASNTTLKIAEGNIVYHPKYGKGTVEELFNYGSRTLCSIQFEGVGIRLLDPNLADLKQV